LRHTRHCGRSRLLAARPDRFPLRGASLTVGGIRKVDHVDALRRKVAVINGGTQGLGKAAAMQMISEGLSGLVVSGRNRERGEAALADFACDARFISVDLAEADAAEQVIAEADNAFGRVDVLVNSAASTGRGSVWNTDAAMWDDMLHVNVRAPGLAISAAAKIMKREGIEGSMVNIGSVSGYGGQDFLYPYAVSAEEVARRAGQLVGRSRQTASIRQAHRPGRSGPHHLLSCVRPIWFDDRQHHRF